MQDGSRAGQASNPAALFSDVWASVSNGLNGPFLATSHTFFSLVTSTHYKQLYLNKSSVIS